MEADPRVERPTIGGVTYTSPGAFGDVAVDDFRSIGNIPKLRRQAVLADAEDHFASLGLYPWDGEFYWGVLSGTPIGRVARRDCVRYDGSCYLG